MTDWIVVAGVVWMLLIGAVIFLAICRITTALEEEKLTRAGLPASHPVHHHVLQVLQSEDRTGIALTALAFVCSVVIAFMLADRILPGGVDKLLEILVVSVQ
ncbi:MAG TPA: hypothetical protein VG273_19690 [Bryobacteraceae bacterium]|jgi:hypothetical protein|nr:hypothetical protein [Bryobacteraceae bacterium]